jgi:hypothetical protein
MSTDIWEQLKEKQAERRSGFEKQALSENKKLEEKKAKLLEPYGGKKNDAPTAIQTQITNLDKEFDSEYLIGGRLERQIVKNEADERSALLKGLASLGEIEMKDELRAELLKFKGKQL